MAGLFFWIYSLRLGVLSDSGRAILFGCLTQRSKDAKKTGNGRKGLQFERGVVERGGASWAALTSAARRLCDSYGAWKLARTAGRETHTTLGPTLREIRIRIGGSGGR